MPNASGFPVHPAWGYKIESTIDLVVPLSGRDHRLGRSYTSRTNMGGPALVGHSWSLNAFWCLVKVPALDVVHVTTPARGRLTFTGPGSKWYLSGPNSQYVQKDSLTIGGQTWPGVQPSGLVSKFVEEYAARGILEETVQQMQRELDLWGSWLRRRRPRPEPWRRGLVPRQAAE